MAFEQSQYKSSNEQQRFARQLDRDLARSSGRLSQSVIRRLITDDTAQWAKSIYDQKLSQVGASNTSAQSSTAPHATTKSSESSATTTSGGASITGLGAAGANSDTISEIPIQPEDGTWVLGSIGGVIQWIATEDCE